MRNRFLPLSRIRARINLPPTIGPETYVLIVKGTGGSANTGILDITIGAVGPQGPPGPPGGSNPNIITQGDPCQTTAIGLGALTNNTTGCYAEDR